MATSIYVYDSFNTYCKYYGHALKDDEQHKHVDSLYIKPDKKAIWFVTTHRNNVGRPAINHSIVHFPYGNIEPYNDPSLPTNEQPIKISLLDMKIVNNGADKSLLNFQMPFIKYFKKNVHSIHINKVYGDKLSNHVSEIYYDFTNDRLNFILNQ